MKEFLKIGLVILGCFLLFGCKSTSYPCPGSGQYKASDMSLFDEDGKPLSGRKKKKNSKKNDYGLINKKQPDKLKRKR